MMKRISYHTVVLTSVRLITYSEFYLCIVPFFRRRICKLTETLKQIPYNSNFVNFVIMKNLAQVQPANQDSENSEVMHLYHILTMYEYEISGFT